MGGVQNPPAKIYVRFERKTPFARARLTTTSSASGWWYESASELWAYDVERAASMNTVLDPADNVLIPGTWTGKFDDRGCAIFELDWSGAVDPQGLPEVVAAARARVLR